jgi:hypothetical protein
MFRLITTFALFLTFCLPAAAQPGPQYTAQVLPAPAGAPGGETRAAALNNRGQVFGVAGVVNFAPVSYVPVVWTSGVPSILSFPSGSGFRLEGGFGLNHDFINDSGTAVSLVINNAVAAKYTNFGRRPIVWQNGTPTILPLPSEQVCSMYLAANAGFSEIGFTEFGLDILNSVPVGLNGQGHVLVRACGAFWIWNGGSFQQLVAQQVTPVIDPTVTPSGNHLNDSDNAVLDMFVPGIIGNPLSYQPAIYSSGDISPLPITAQFDLATHTINNSGQVLFFFPEAGSGGRLHLQLWDGTRVVDLGLGGGASLNNRGEVVFSTPFPFSARIYKNGVLSPLDIPAPLAGGALLNDAGQIAANTSLTVSQPYAVLFTPTTPTPSDSTAPTLSLPSNITAEATGPAGAVITYSASATDDTDPHPALDCGPPSGSTFGLGTTTVRCTAKDASDNSVSGNFNITVVDTSPPALTPPPNINVDADSPLGAVISFTTSVTDIADPLPAVSCSPISGSTFAIGTTTVQCIATDASHNSSQASFTVTVKGADAQTASLIALVQSFNLAQGITNSLDAKLQNVLDALSAANAGNRADACNRLAAFINNVSAQSGKQLTIDQANQLIAKANRIRAVQGCL